MRYIDETLQLLREYRTQSNSVCVSYSGGKDSLVVMDMCQRTFARVEAFVMEFVPGLALIDSVVDYARDRWQIECRRYLHWSSVRAMAAGVYCDTNWKKEIPKMSLTDVYAQVRRDTGINLIATGAKRSDSIWRRRVMARTKSAGDVVTPLAGWQKAHVLAYLQSREIPIPKNEGSNANGVDLSSPSLLWLHDNHPADFDRLTEVYPYARSVVWRRKFFNIPSARKVRDADDQEVGGEGSPIQSAHDLAGREAEAKEGD